MSGRAVAAFAAVGLVAGVALALAVTAATDEVYEATALLQAVAPEPGAPEAEEAQAAAASYAEVGESRGFLADHAAALGGRLSPDELAERLDVRHPEGTGLVEIVARGETPAEARVLADAMATTLVAGAERSASAERLLVAALASADDDPIRPRRVLNLVGGVLLGLVAGLGSCLLYRRRPASAAAEAAPSVRAAPR